MEYLDFEKELEELENQIKETKEVGKKTNSDVKEIIKNLKSKIHQKKKEIYQNITAWERVQISRHPKRPYTLDYIQYLTEKKFIDTVKNFTIYVENIDEEGNMENLFLKYINITKCRLYCHR